MPPVKLSRIVYVPVVPDKKDPGTKGNLTFENQSYSLPADSLNCDIDMEVMADFLDAIAAHGVGLEDGLEKALTIYTNRLNNRP